MRLPLLSAALLGLSILSTTVSAAPPTGEALRGAFVREFERPRVPLEPQVVSSDSKDGLRTEKLTVASQAGVRVPILLVRPETVTGRLPVVIALHGLGGNKEGLRDYLQDFAKRGMIGVSLDARYHGDRAGDVQAAMAEAYRKGNEHPYLWDTVWDTWRVMDYLQARPDIDRDRIGVMGISLGGHTTWMVSADPRVKVAVPCISVCSWKWQLAHQGYKQRVANLSKAFDAVRTDLGETEVTPRVVAAAWHKWLPGIPEKYDCQDILAAFAPRPLLIIGGDSDPVAPLEGAKEAWAQIEPAYASAPDHVKLMIAEKSGHTVTGPQRQALLDWFERWLKTSAN